LTSHLKLTQCCSGPAQMKNEVPCHPIDGKAVKKSRGRQGTTSGKGKAKEWMEGRGWLELPFSWFWSLYHALSSVWFVLSTERLWDLLWFLCLTVPQNMPWSEGFSVIVKYNDLFLQIIACTLMHVRLQVAVSLTCLLAHEIFVIVLCSVELSLCHLSLFAISTEIWCSQIHKLRS
jgi:hypothetical protein